MTNPHTALGYCREGRKVLYRVYEYSSALYNFLQCTLGHADKTQKHTENGKMLESHKKFLVYALDSGLGQTIKTLPAMQVTQVQSLGQEDILEKVMATHSSILSWRISWMEEPGGLQSIGLQRVRHDLMTKPPSNKIAKKSAEAMLKI